MAAGSRPAYRAAPAEEVQAGGGAREHRGWAQRHIDHIRDETNAGGVLGEGGKQSPGVEKPRLIGVILHAQEVEPQAIGVARKLDDRFGARGVRSQEEAEPQVVAEIAHSFSLCTKYSIELDTSVASPMECAQRIKAAVENGHPRRAFRKLGGTDDGRSDP